jgi:hydroxyethylthiazole kinase-like uncharacterized protein yjeF
VNRSNSNTHLPRKLYTAEQVRALDALLVEHIPISALKLMRRAATVVLSVISQRWPQLRRLVVFVGTGNNGGDGYYIAALAAAEGIKVQVLECGDLDRLRGDAASAREEALANGVSCKQCDILLDLASAEFGQETVLVDALLGIGHSGPLRGAYEPIIDWMNGSGLSIVSVDVPSGLNCDTGHVAEVAICASMTVCLVALKQGLFTGNGPEQAGEIVFHDLGMPEALKTNPVARSTASTRIDINYVSSMLKPRRLDAHKGDCGNVLVLGGDVGYGGAALMAAEAAARMGAGTVSLVTRSPHVTASLARRPEIMVRAIEEPDAFGSEQLLALMQKASVIVVGPGLGNSNWSYSLLRQALEFAGSHLPVVLDADALNLLAETSELNEDPLISEGRTMCMHSPQWVLTPHPGEAARLLKNTVEQVQEDRFAAARSLQAKFGGAVLLKGAGSLLCCPGEVVNFEPEPARVEVCTEGNPGMASGGMGDVLSGMLGGLIAQGLSVSDALRCGVCMHGEAADLAAVSEGERGLLATDLFDHIRRLANNL